MMKKFDIFPKSIKNEYDIQTEAGGILTILSISFLIWAILSEIFDYRNISKSESLVLEEKNLPKFIEMELDATVYNNCSSLHFDITSTNYKSMIDCEIVKKFVSISEKECHVHLKGLIPNIPASFHIGLGVNSFSTGEHQHMTILLRDKNVSHKINKIRFGSADVKSPLDGTIVTIDKPYQYQLIYHAQLIPVTTNGQIGYQVIASLIKARLDKLRNKQYAGIYFSWNFFPIGFESTVRKEPIINLVCHLLAITGSFFVFIHFADSLLYFISKRFSSQKKGKGYSILINKE